MSHVTYMNESCHTYELRANLLSVLMLGSSSITHMNESRHAYEWVMSHIWTSHVTHERVTWLIHLFSVLMLGSSSITYKMTHLYVWHDSFICVTWLIHMCDMTHSHVWHDSSITHMNVWHDSSIHHTHMNQRWRTQCHEWVTCDMTHSSITHIWMRDEEPSIMNESCLTYEWVTSHMNVRHDSFIYHTYEWETSTAHMGWLRWVGSIKF